MFKHFEERVADEELPPEKRRVKFTYNGLYYGEDVLLLYHDWEAMEFDPIKVWGVPLVGLPPKLRKDMITLRLMHEWHRRNAKKQVKTPELEAKHPLKR